MKSMLIVEMISCYFGGLVRDFGLEFQ